MNLLNDFFKISSVEKAESKFIIAVGLNPAGSRSRNIFGVQPFKKRIEQIKANPERR